MYASFRKWLLPATLADMLAVAEKVSSPARTVFAAVSFGEKQCAYLGAPRGVLAFRAPFRATGTKVLLSPPVCPSTFDFSAA